MLDLEPIEKQGTTPSRIRFWNDARDAVLSLQKKAGKNVSVSEHKGKGTIINVTEPTAPFVCCDGFICRNLQFHPNCQDICGVFPDPTTHPTCDYCAGNWCPPHTSHVTAVVSGISECACRSIGGGEYLLYTFDVDGTYDMGTMSVTVPCVWEIELTNVVTQGVYTTSDCSGDPFETTLYSVFLRFSCTSELPEVGVSITGRINETTSDIFDLFDDTEGPITHTEPWTLTNTISCTSHNVGTGGTIVYSWS